MQEKFQIKSIIKQNILLFIDFKCITKYEFYKKTGITRGILDQNNGISEENITKFLAYFSEVSPEWLITGKGEMLKTADKPKESVKDCQLCKEKDKVIAAQKDTIILLKDKVENLNFRMRELEDKYYTPVTPEPKLKYKHAKK